MNPKYPVYIISKGRWELRWTSRVLDSLGVPYHIVIEPQEYSQYAAVIDPGKILVLPFSNLGQGSIPARNWVWEHSIESGASRHWILDDNIEKFFMLNNNQKWLATDGTIFRVSEEFVDRYKNVPMAGFEYALFKPKKQKSNPFAINRRVYSCILLSNDVYPKFAWRGKYNEDTDLSLRFLKAGYCTVLFYVFLAKKRSTLSHKGGNTDELYKKTNNRLEFAQELQRAHPDVVKIVWKYNRWHHEVNYRPFKNNKLILKDGIEIPQGVNNYGMKLVKIDDPDAS